MTDAFLQCDFETNIPKFRSVSKQHLDQLKFYSVLKKPVWKAIGKCMQNQQKCLETPQMTKTDFLIGNCLKKSYSNYELFSTEMRQHFNQSLMPNPDKYGHDFAAHERYTRGCKFAPGSRFVFLHPGANTAHKHGYDNFLSNPFIV